MKITGLTRRLRAQAGPHDDKALAYSSRNVNESSEIDDMMGLLGSLMHSLLQCLQGG